ncbi:RagB/SusD family nutrient uptake outer membrane protein [Niabella drilacis]|uniref:Starch-binding associating with outer membrane n=1 Tax=Niabella drilacis (strain DSM 25811 / CCM 8410 / CCUG 62505 / LMG 26954 / E90) TaxID=1285928 RepID=A0A1G6KSU6_NIADE|nr:RagB/SusD family nutrient uptake outer membrane protein [Niabella drilacis]SDC33446.1 Starch-binding associating with outer membrane [Niabella drilacis]
MKQFIYSLFFAALCTSQACTKILDTAPYNSVASGNMWTNAALTNQGVAGIYANLRGWGVYGSATYGLTVIPFECLGMTGEAYRSIPYMNGTAGSGDQFFSTMWKTLYEGVHRANDGIFNLSQPGGGGVDDETRTRLLAESKFLRAYYYMRLNELYGRYGTGVPLYTEPLASVEEATKTQSSEAAVWDQIIKDLTDCINEPNFPNRYREKGRASKGAAYALRGRAYLMQGAKYNYNNNTGVVEGTTIDKPLLQKAADDFAKVQSCGYDLFQAGYAALFTEANEASVEMIFSLQNIAKPGYGSRMQLMAGTRSAGDKTGSTGFSQYSAPPAMVDLYEYKDGTPFNWENVIPGYFATPEKDRLVYFLRDKEANGQPIVSTAMATLINNKLSPLATKSRYLAEGNEARLKKAWQNRDPRFYANLIVPYGDQYLGTDANQATNGNLTPVPYVYRWPVGATNQSVAAQTTMGISSPFDLRQDGTSEAEFAFRHRKFVMKGYEADYINDNPIDEPILRYAYVLLMWAEALAQQGDLDGAAQKVNLVRARTSVEMPAYTFSNLEDAMTKIRDESRRELMNEGVNFYEELRWGTLRQTKYSKYMGYIPAAHTCNGQQSNGNGTIQWSSTNDFSIFPVPSAEIEKNPSLKKTPGWIY